MDSNVLFEQISERIVVLRDLKEGFLTNIFFGASTVDMWGYSNKSATLNVLGKSLFVLRENEGFFNLYFASTTPKQLTADLSNFMATASLQLPILVDLIGRNKDFPSIEQPFTDNGYSQYCSLMRMSRPITQEVLLPQKEITYATKEQAKQIHELLHCYFDPFSEQLPTLPQIEQWTEQKRILIREIDKKIAGFLIFEINGITSYLRYWFTHPNYRDKKVGSGLLRHFFAESSSTTRQLFWVIQNNDNAIIRYRHYGFKEENMFDKVLIFKP